MDAGFFDVFHDAADDDSLAVADGIDIEFGCIIEELVDEFPEAQERTRKWVSPTEAAELVEEPGLQKLLREI